jgi:signal transduction histidine kinase/ligand-binding sensor domain-containing protein
MRIAFLLGALTFILLFATACDGSRVPSSPEPVISASATVGTDLGETAAPSGGTQGGEPLPSPRSLDLGIKFEHVLRDAGLSQGSIWCILQDSLGYMWFCTEDGLYRYDAYDLAVFRHDPDDPDSLGQGGLWSVYEDQAGMLWIWKYRGDLDRYDRDTGRFFHYDLSEPVEAEGASSDFIWTYYEDSGGTLWVGTYQSGLFQYDRDEDRFIQYRHDPNDPHSLSDDRVYAIHEDGEGTLWLGTREGLSRLDRETGRFTRYQHDPDDPHSLGSHIVQLIHEDQAGRFWVTTYGVGLEQFDRQTGKVVARYEHDPDDPTSIDDTNAISVLFEDRLGMIWLVHFDGRLDRLDPETGTFTRFRHDPEDTDPVRGSLSHNHVSFVDEDRAGNLWIGTSAGLDRYDRETGQFVHYRHDPGDPHSLSSDAVTRFYQDRADGIWIGTQGKGLNLYDPRSTKFAHHRIQVRDVDAESNNVVNAIFQDSAGILWIGTDAGLNRLDRETGQVTHYRHDPEVPESLSPGWVASIHEDRESRLWVGTQSGLDELDRLTGRFTHYLQVSPDEADLSIGTVTSMIEDDSGELWLGRHRYGLCRFDPDTGECDRYAYNPEYALNPQNMIRQVYEGREGFLWLSTQGGLLKFDQQTGSSTLYERDLDSADAMRGSLSHNQVESVLQDDSGVLWVATHGGGLNRFDPSTETFTHYTDKDGLPSNVILGILQDAQGNVWLSTNNGLSRLNPQAESFVNYDTGDGLQGSDFTSGAYFQSAEGEIFFGGADGFNAFHSEDIQDNPHAPPIVLTQLTQGGVDVEPGVSIEGLTEATFGWPNNFFEFEFAALSYSQSEKNQYAYMLEGFRDESWNYIGTRRFGRYTNLPGGTYTLRLKGSNSDGVWNEEGAALRITVVPPFWDTWYFRGLVTVALALLALGAYWMRVRNIRTASHELELQVSSRTRELAALNAIAAVVSRSLDPQQILTDAVDKILEVTELEAGGIYLIQENRHGSGSEGVLRIVVQRGLSPELVEGIDNLVVGEGFSGRVAQSGEALVVGDLTNDPRLTRTVVKASGFKSVAIAPVVSRASVFGTLFVMTRDQTEFTPQDIELLSSIGFQIGVAIENARLFAAEQRRAEQLDLINQAGRELTLSLGVDEILAQVTRMIQKAFGYYHVGIGLIEGEEVVYRVGAGELWDDPDFEFKPARLKVGEEGISGWVAARGEPLLVPDVRKDPRYVWLRDSRTRSEITVPIMVKGRVIGVLDVESDRLDAFDDTDLAVLQSLAHQVAAAVENARLYEQAQQTAVLEERSRLARELHDAVTQTLFSASLIAEAVPASWELDQQEGRELLDELRQLTRGALAEMRTLLLELRPASLVETGLRDLLHQLAEAAMGRIGVPVSVTVDGECTLPPDAHVALYRITQEALNNVVKHARASQVEVALLCKTADAAGGKEVELRIHDDGRGFDPSDLAPDRLGLSIMRERAENIGADLQIWSELGQGTKIGVLWQEAASPEPH